MHHSPIPVRPPYLQKRKTKAYCLKFAVQVKIIHVVSVEILRESGILYDDKPTIQG